MSSILGPVAAFLSSVTWALGSTTFSRLSRTQSAFSINITRAILAVPVFVAVSFLFQDGLLAWQSVTPRHLGWFFSSAIASYALGDSLFMWSTRGLGIPGALALASTYPIWSSTYGWVIRGESCTGLQLLGLTLTVSGVIYVILRSPKPTESVQAATQTTSRLDRKSAGVVLGVLTSLCWALNSISVSEGGQGVSPFVANGARMVMAVLVTSILSSVFLRQKPRLVPWPNLKPVLWIFLAETLLGSFFFLYGLSHSPMVLGSTLTSLAPVLSVFVAVAMGLEKFSWHRLLGVVVVVSGLALLVAGR